uniref:G-protein coupled receptors family 1 profile domain-containing protein n=1 Tax=Malurus cyaneus samueli TaxID=2593467 RepID=A0A8C5TP36_9PASS
MTNPPYAPTASSSNPAMTQSNQSCSSYNITFKSSFYATTYTLIFIPGLLANSAALWVLCRFVSRKSKAVIFMINLAVADLAHVLSLPLRIYYYINHSWPFGNALCLLCFYLKYLNMYASICFLCCISIQRYLFLLHPFKAKGWKRRYDVAISALVWLLVGAACVPFPLMRSHGLAANNTNVCRPAGKPISSKALLGFVGPKRGERSKALRMVSMCAIVFCVCFAPYHINFFFYMLVKEEVITDCFLSTITLYTQPFCLSLASFDCCLDPIIYFFMTSEFQDQFSRHSSMVIRSRLMSKERPLNEGMTRKSLRKTKVFCVKCETVLGYSMVEDPAGLSRGVWWQWSFFST